MSGMDFTGEMPDFTDGNFPTDGMTPPDFPMGDMTPPEFSAETDPTSDTETLSNETTIEDSVLIENTESEGAETIPNSEGQLDLSKDENNGEDTTSDTETVSNETNTGEGEVTEKAESENEETVVDSDNQTDSSEEGNAQSSSEDTNGSVISAAVGGRRDHQGNRDFSTKKPVQVIQVISREGIHSSKIGMKHGRLTNNNGSQKNDQQSNVSTKKYQKSLQNISKKQAISFRTRNSRQY